MGKDSRRIRHLRKMAVTRRVPRSMVSARRLVYLIAAALLAAALANVLIFPATDWYRETILQAVCIAAIELALLAGFLELIARFVTWQRSRIHLLILAAPPMLLSSGYVFGCAWSGREVAQFDTWHLVAMFAIISFVWALFAAIAMSALVGAGFMIRDFLTRR